MIDPKQREQLHEILDLVLDINDMESPTAFFNFSGHVNGVDAQIYADGWKDGNEADVSLGTYTDKQFKSNPTVEAIIATLKQFKESQITECTQCGETCVKEDSLQTVDGAICEDCTEDTDTHG